MSDLLLGLNLPARLGIDPWFVMKRAAAHSNATVTCDLRDNSQRAAYGLFLINLCRTPKLLTWNSTSTLWSEVSKEHSIKSSPCVLQPAKRKCPVHQQRLPKIVISDEGSNLAMALVSRVDSELTSLNQTVLFIPLTEDQSKNFHIFNELLAEHNVSTDPNLSLLTSKLPSITPNSSQGTKRSLSNSHHFTTNPPISKQSKPALHWTEILDDLMTASDWEEAKEESKQESHQKKSKVTETSLNQNVPFTPLTEDQSENFQIYNALLSEYNVSTCSNPPFVTYKLPLNTPDSSQGTKKLLSNSQPFTPCASCSKKSKPTFHWTEILDNLMTVSDWEEAKEESKQESQKNSKQTLDQEACASAALELIPLTFVESSNFDIFNQLVLEYQLLETLKSSSSEVTITLAFATFSPSPRQQKSPSKPKPKSSSKSFKDTERQLCWSEILDDLMTDKDQKEADESFKFDSETITLPLCPEKSLQSPTFNEILSISLSYSSAQNTHALPTPIEELNDPFEFIITNHQNSYLHSDMSFEIVKSSSKENDYISMDFVQ